MRWDLVTGADRDLVGRCLDAAATGPFFDNREFHTLFGIYRADLDRVREQWPKVDAEDTEVRLAVINTLNNLLGYPHGHALETAVGHTAEEIRATLDRLIALEANR